MVPPAALCSAIAVNHVPETGHLDNVLYGSVL